MKLWSYSSNKSTAFTGRKKIRPCHNDVTTTSHRNLTDLHAKRRKSVTWVTLYQATGSYALAAAVFSRVVTQVTIFRQGWDPPSYWLPLGMHLASTWRQLGYHLATGLSICTRGLQEKIFSITYVPLSTYVASIILDLAWISIIFISLCVVRMLLSLGRKKKLIEAPLFTIGSDLVDILRWR